MTLVVAPAGYGKTTLVAEWARQSPLRVAWLSLDEADNALPAFVAYVVAAVRTLFPDACPATAGLAAESPVDVLATILVNEIDDLPERFVLVLDDLHFVTQPAVHSLLDRLVQWSPLQMHLVLTSRSDPPLALARARASGNLTELRPRDLRFSPAESETYLSQATGLGDPRLLKALAGRADGWAAGMQLASLSLQGLAEPGPAIMDALANPDDRFVLDYVSEQVVQRQPPEERSFLLKMAILRRVCDPLAAAVAAPDAPVPLASIERDGLFLTALDSSGEWYAFHGLFREQLLRMLKETLSPDEIAELHRRAARWLADAGLVERAVHHALEAGDTSLVVAIARPYLVERLVADRPEGMAALLAQLPIEIIESDPWLLLARASTLNAQLHLGAIPPVIEKTERLIAELGEAIDPEERALLRVYIDWLWVSHWITALQPQRLKEAAQRALDGIPPGYPSAAEPALIRLPIGLQWLGEFESAEQWLNAQLAGAPNTAWPALRRLRTLFALTILYMSEGYLNKGNQLGLLLLMAAQEFHSADMESMARLALGAAAYYTNRLEEAVGHFEAGVELRYETSRIVSSQESLVGLALSYHALGRVEEARGVLAILGDFHREVVNPQLLVTYRSLQALLALMDGNLVEARRWSGDIATEAGLGLGWMAVPVVTNIRVQIAGGEPDQLDQCLSELERLLKEATRVRQPTRQTELYALMAVTFLKLGRPDEAADALRSALAVGEPRGLVRPIISAGRPIDVLLEVVSRDKPSPFITTLQAALRAGSPSPLPAEAPYLTPREKEVLALLAEYQTDRAIAETLVVSPLTIRTHIENIAEKLGVRGRRNVVTRAREVGLLA